MFVLPEKLPGGAHQRPSVRERVHDFAPSVAAETNGDDCRAMAKIQALKGEYNIKGVV